MTATESSLSYHIQNRYSKLLKVVIIKCHPKKLRKKAI